jgi:hypothetical protein
MKKVNQIVEIYDILVPHIGADYKAAEILDLAIGFLDLANKSPDSEKVRAPVRSGHYFAREVDKMMTDEPFNILSHEAILWKIYKEPWESLDSLSRFERLNREIATVV